MSIIFHKFNSMSAHLVVSSTLAFQVSTSKNKPFTLCPRGSRCILSRRDFALRGIVATGASTVSTLTTTKPISTPRAMEILPFKSDGYNYWLWRDRKIHYVVKGEGLPIVLIHGFGASVFHWRYNIPELAKTYKVYALDLLGFGWSEKALIEYDALVWRDQVVDFVKEIVGEPAVVVGNSLGGFTALVSAISMKDQVKGVVLLNSAGQFGGTNIPTEKSEETTFGKLVVKPVKEYFQRLFLGFLFWQSKQPARIESVLKSVSLLCGIRKSECEVSCSSSSKIEIKYQSIKSNLVSIKGQHMPVVAPHSQSTLKEENLIKKVNTSANNLRSANFPTGHTGLA